MKLQFKPATLKKWWFWLCLLFTIGFASNFPEPVAIVVFIILLCVCFISLFKPVFGNNEPSDKSVNATMPQTRKYNITISGDEDEDNDKFKVYEYDDVQIAIIRGQEPDFKRVIKGSPVNFVQEPENQYDPHAIAVYSNSIKLGYLYKGWLQDMVNDFLRRHDTIEAIISSADREANKICLLVFMQRIK